MIHAKFQDHRTSGYGEDFYHVNGHGSHLGHVARTIYINFCSPFPRRLHMKFGIDWPSGFRGEMFENNGYAQVYSPGAGADNPLLGSNFFINSIIQSILSFAASFPPLNDCNSFPHLNVQATQFALAEK